MFKLVYYDMTRNVKVIKVLGQDYTKGENDELLEYITSISCVNKSIGTPAFRSSSRHRYMATLRRTMSIAGKMSSKPCVSMNVPYSVVALAVGAGERFCGVNEKVPVISE